MRPLQISLALSAGLLFSGLTALAWTGPGATTPPNSNVSAPINVGSAVQTKLGNLGVLGNLQLAGAGGSYLNFGAVADVNGYGIRDFSGSLQFKNSGGSWNDLSTTIANYLGIGAITSIKFTDGSTITSASTAGPWSKNGTNVYYNTGNVGVASTTPAQKLSVDGKIYSASGGFQFPDGTVQTTAGGGISAVTTASCATNTFGGGQNGYTCTVACPAPYFRTGCSSPNYQGTGAFNTTYTVVSTANPSDTNSCVCSSTAGGNTCTAYCAK